MILFNPIRANPQAPTAMKDKALGVLGVHVQSAAAYRYRPEGLGFRVSGLGFRV